MKYLGYPQENDPFYGYLRYDILPLLDVDGQAPRFRVCQLPASHSVYLYEDQRSQTRIIGKFFGGASGHSPEAGFHHMEREFNNLNHLRSIGFTGYPHYGGLSPNLRNFQCYIKSICY